MKILYKKKSQNSYLFYSLIWLVLGVVRYYSTPNWASYSWISLSVFFLAFFFYLKREKYLIVENGIIGEDWKFGKKLKLNEIKQLKKDAKKYILKTNKNQLIINTQLIDKKSLMYLNAELKKLDVHWD